MNDSIVSLAQEGGDKAPRWLLLIHQLPPEPAYVRVKVRRRLRQLGAAALKNSVYVLPHTEEHLEDFQWLANEIVADGGDATICAASMLSGASDEDLEALFPGLRSSKPDTEALVTANRPRGATWVTRQGVFVDRIASAWLIRGFIDPEAKFRFVPAGRAKKAVDEFRFDMYQGEFTHVGDRCTFETLLAHFGLHEPPLHAIGEIVHDIDCKDAKFARVEAPGVAALLVGITHATQDDAERLARGAAVFDALYESLRK